MKRYTCASVIFILFLSGCDLPFIKPEETPTPTITATIPPTATSLPPTATVPPPQKLTEYLNGVTIVSIDTFDELDDIWWNDAGKISNGQMVATGNDWNAFGLTPAFVEGEGMTINLLYSDKAELEVFFHHGEWEQDDYRRFGIYAGYLYPTANTWKGKNHVGYSNLNGNFRPKQDTWYQLLLAVAPDGEFLAVLWETADPTKTILYHEKIGADWAGREWNFVFGINQGSVTVDDFMKFKFDEIK